jgi:hypothetical protein
MRERVIRGERVMWERAVTRQSTLSKRIDENLFAFWIKLPLLLQVLGAVTLDFLRRSPIHAERLDRCDPRTLDVSRET